MIVRIVFFVSKRELPSALHRTRAASASSAATHDQRCAPCSDLAAIRRMREMRRFWQPHLGGAVASCETLNSGWKAVEFAPLHHVTNRRKRRTPTAIIRVSLDFSKAQGLL